MNVHTSSHHFSLKVHVHVYEQLDEHAYVKFTLESSNLLINAIVARKGYLTENEPDGKVPCPRH